MRSSIRFLSPTDNWQLTTGNWQLLLSDCTYNSATRFVAPITLVGFTALSVLTSTNAATPIVADASATIFVPKTLFLMASHGFASIIGTCLCAAQWKTTCGRSASKTWRTRRASQTSPM